ncbi:unnamed protein product [Trichogramma brassicae]|uniref:Uncharacterized protein n=1 Tax=Trichogramma brassicae TaxID=86971 RepID=A0A6H5J149_9HYME|nr:unnamed protein product [Trichogramma brassicae]
MNSSARAQSTPMELQTLGGAASDRSLALTTTAGSQTTMMTTGTTTGQAEHVTSSGAHHHHHQHHQHRSAAQHRHHHHNRSRSAPRQPEKPARKRANSATLKSGISLASIPAHIRLTMLNSGLLSFAEFISTPGYASTASGTRNI